MIDTSNQRLDNVSTGAQICPTIASSSLAVVEIYLMALISVASVLLNILSLSVLLRLGLSVPEGVRRLMTHCAWAQVIMAFYWLVKSAYCLLLVYAPALISPAPLIACATLEVSRISCKITFSYIKIRYSTSRCFSTHLAMQASPSFYWSSS